MSKSGLYDITLIFIKKLPASILVKETEDGNRSHFHCHRSNTSTPRKPDTSR